MITSPSGFIATYSSALTKNSPTFTRYGADGIYYYEAIIINVSINGFYSFKSDSTIDSYGYLYAKNFNPVSPSHNLLEEDDDGAESLFDDDNYDSAENWLDDDDDFDSAENLLDDDDYDGDHGVKNSQFLIEYRLKSNERYILIQTTYDGDDELGDFSIIASGPGTIHFNHMNNLAT